MLKPTTAALPCSGMTLQRLFLKAAASSCCSLTLEMSHTAFLLHLGDYNSLWRSQKSSSMAQVLPPEQMLSGFDHIYPHASHGCPCAWHSPGPHWDGNRSCLLGLSPLHPVSFGRISSSPDMQRPWGRHVMVCVLVCCARCCSSCPIHKCMAQTSAPRDSGMDVNG